MTWVYTGPMRRTTSGVTTSCRASDSLDARIARADAHDPDRVARILEPMVTELRRARLLDVIARRLGSVAVVFDRPYDPHNGAAVLRSCEAFGIQQLHVVERPGVPFAVASSVARGADKWVDVTCHGSPHFVIAWARAAEMPLVAAHPGGEIEPHQLARYSRLALVLGNEREGIGTELEAACQARVSVPMRGFAESLNVSVTAAILLHAATEGRPGDIGPHDRRRLYARGLYLSVERAEEILAVR
jgi:tRNA (guanosine-2'-O-)-methyltransferase